MKRRTSAGMILFEIFMILAALVFIYPVFYVLINAFKDTQEIVLNPAGLPIHPSLQNFIKVWNVVGSGGVNFAQSFINTLVLTVLSVSGIILFSAMAAHQLVRRKAKLSTALFALFTFFLVIPFQIIMVPLVVLATDLNLTDTLGLAFLYFGLGVPMAIFMYHGFIKGVPLSLEESAEMDGAGAWKIFVRIVMPLLNSITATIAILDLLWVWNDFLLPYIILRKGTLVLFQFNFFGTYTQDYGALTASLVMTATPVVILYIVLQKFVIKGIIDGAIKG